MLDYNNLIKNIDKYINQLNKRGQDYSYLNKLVDLIKERNKLIFSSDNLKQQRNNLSKEIPSLVKKDWKDPEILIIKNKVKNIKLTITNNLKSISDMNAKILEIILNTPNLPYENCPVGTSDKYNVEIRKWGIIDKTKTVAHWDILANKKMVDYKVTSENSGSRFITYLNEGATLKRGLKNFMLDVHTKNGYNEIDLPILVKQESMFGTGQFPKFINDAYICKDGLVLIPTSEVSVTNFHKNDIIPYNELPKKYVSFSNCFRKEAGAAGKDTKGIIRLHQFSKVELVKIVNPKDSYEELDKLLSDAESILQKLDLPYRIIELCTGDLGFSAAKTYDIEVWMPGRNNYMEISSCSNFENFQSRRINIKYKGKNKNHLVHTINGSGLAIDRLIAAIIENYYSVKTDKIKIPQILEPYLNIKEI